MIDFQNATGTCLSKDTSVVKFLSKFDKFFQRYEASCGQMSYLRMVKNLSGNSCLQIHADDFQNLISSSLSIHSEP